MISLNKIFVYIIGKVSSFDVDLNTQKVTVESNISYDDILAIIKKTGKEASFYLLSVVIINVHNIALGSIWGSCQLMELYSDRVE